jgi:integrase/recombinase XerD
VKTVAFQSALGPAMNQLLVIRRSLGYSDRTLPSYFASFDRYLVAHVGVGTWLTRATAEAWVASDPNLAPASRSYRLSTLRILARYLIQQHPETYVPGPAPGLTSRFRPHIYTPAEIQSLLKEASLLKPMDSLRPRTFVTLIGLLYCTGLRVSEALGLRLADVDVNEGLLIVRNAKFHKTRAVPLQSNAKEAVAAYVDARRQYRHRTDSDAPFLVNEWHRPCSYGTVVATFLAISRRVGIRGAPCQRGPRLHDLRHTFAVHRLLSWYRDGGDVQARLPLLSTYMGHVCLVSTQVYLNITSELLHEAAQRFQPPTLARTAGGPS